MDTVDQQYYEQYFENLSYEQKIRFLELYDEYADSKMGILLHIIFLFPFNVFKKNFTGYQPHIILSTISLIILITDVVLISLMVFSIFSLIIYLTLVELITLVNMVFVFFGLACRIFAIININKIILASNQKTKEKVISIIEGE